MTKGLGFGRSLRGTPGDSRMFAGLRRPRLRSARLKRAEERRNDIRSKPLFRTLRVIPLSDCYTTPAAGYRNYTVGALTSVSAVGRCWGSSSFSTGSYFAASLHGTATEISPVHQGYRAHAFSVRCVQASAKVALFTCRTHRTSSPITGEEVRRPAPPKITMTSTASAGNRKKNHR